MRWSPLHSIVWRSPLRINWNWLALVLRYTTNSVVQGLSWTADRCSVGQEVRLVYGSRSITALFTKVWPLTLPWATSIVPYPSTSISTIHFNIFPLVFMWRSKSAQAVILLACVWGMLGSNLGRDTQFPVRRFSWFSQVQMEILPTPETV